MQYREFGKTGLKVSRLGFGAMRPPWLEGGEVDMDLFLAVMHRAIDHGVNWIDTAYVYAGGKSEEAVGRAIRGRRDQVVISTKVPCRFTATQWEKALKTSLKRLGTHIDFLLFHGLALAQTESRSYPAIVKRAEKALKKGDVKMLAFSCHDTPENAIKLLDTGMFRAILVQFNLLNRAYGPVLEHAHKKGVGTLVMGPVAGGVLAEPSRVLKRLSPVKVGSTAELAMRYVLSNPNVDVALSGMNGFDMVDENCAVADMKRTLTQPQRKKLVKELEERFEIGQKICTGCGYCMPCPKGVDIPTSFRALTMKKIWGLNKAAERTYRSIGKGNRKDLKTPEACVECGLCEPKCPQTIEIRKQLKQVLRTFGGAQE
jgi:predicted aldo/keto reductase-like oxidoreductase